MNKVRNENDRLRNDVKRLHYLLEETEKYRTLPREIERCHFLGRPERESDMWFQQDIIGETEHFLKKWQLGGNKDYVDSMVKFIQKQLKRTAKETTSRLKKDELSRRKDQELRHNRSLGIHSMAVPNRSLGKSQQLNNSAFLRGSRRYSQLHGDSKRVTESFLYDKLEKSLAAH